VGLGAPARQASRPESLVLAPGWPVIAGSRSARGLL